jgi:hypothetical protein
MWVCSVSGATSCRKTTSWPGTGPLGAQNWRVMAFVRRPGLRTPLAALVALLGLLIAAGPAGAALPQQSGSVDVLAGNFGARVVGTAGFTGSHPYAVAGIGDMFGDGFSDVAVTAGHGALPVDVVRGRTSAADIPFGALGSGLSDRRFLQPRSGSHDRPRRRCQRGGIPDLLVAEPFASPRGRANAGSVFVVFGKHDTNTVDLANLGNGGFRIDGALAGDQIGYNGSTGGWALAGGQDLNGDGKSDILIGATVDAGSRPAWVVFGTSSSSPVDLATLAADGNGYEIDPPGRQDLRELRHRRGQRSGPGLRPQRRRPW